MKLNTYLSYSVTKPTIKTSESVTKTCENTNLVLFLLKELNSSNTAGSGPDAPKVVSRVPPVIHFQFPEKSRIYHL